jgi:hypothetical protein
LHIYFFKKPHTKIVKLILLNKYCFMLNESLNTLVELDKQIKEEKLAADAAGSTPAGDPPNKEVVAEETEEEKATKAAALEAERLAKGEQNPSEPVVVSKEEEEYKGLSYDEIFAKKEEKKAEERERELLKKAKENPISKVVLEAVEKGDDVSKVLEAIKTTKPEDYSERQLFEMTLSAEDRAGDIDELFENFNSMPVSVKTALIEGKRNELKAQYEAVLNGFNSQSRQFETLMKAVPDGINSRVKELIGKEIEGIDITPALAVKIAEEAFDIAALSRYHNGGEYNFDLLMNHATRAIIAPAREKNIAKEAASAATRAVFEKVHSPDGGSADKGKQVASKTKLDADLEALQKYAESRNPFGKKN